MCLLLLLFLLHLTYSGFLVTVLCPQHAAVSFDLSWLVRNMGTFALMLTVIGSDVFGLSYDQDYFT
jgi:hypothetical protein